MPIFSSAIVAPTRLPAPLTLGGVPFHDSRMARVERAIGRRVSAYTTTGPAQLAGLCQAIAYVEKAQVEGAVVECGVGRGGNMMAAALALLQLGSTCRQLYLFDSFAGGRLHEVRANLTRTCYPFEKLIFVAGDTETTLPAEAPGRIALLHLDTCSHDVTRHALETLYPRLAPGGVLVVEGGGQAVNEYFARTGEAA